jgi:arsenite methyltransferase
MSKLKTIEAPCCGPTCCTDAKTADTAAVIREKYGAVAESALSSRHAGVHGIAEAFGYTADELASIPADANMGLSCGNPTATANLRPGETVVDFGCGGGIDVLLAAKKVGPTGRSIGIDMTPAMIERAKKNSAGVGNVEFHLAGIDRLPLVDASVDCIISNCVINLAADKNAVFREAARVLKPGGRFAVSDIALKKPLPPGLATDVAALVGCIAGAIPIEDFRAGLTAAGFAAVEVIDSGADLNAYAKVDGQAGCCSPAMDGSESCCTPAADSTASLHAGLSAVLAAHDVNEYAASVKVFAIKPA